MLILGWIFLNEALSLFRLGPSGGFFLVPPRKKERMRLKGGADRLLAPAAEPPSLKDPSRRAFTSEKQCFGGVLSKVFGTLKSMNQWGFFLFSHGENSP